VTRTGLRTRCVFCRLSASYLCALRGRSSGRFLPGQTITIYVGHRHRRGAVSAIRWRLRRDQKYIPRQSQRRGLAYAGRGAGSRRRASSRASPADGTAWASSTRGFMLAPLPQAAQANFQPARFNWIGSPRAPSSIGQYGNPRHRCARLRTSCKERSWSPPLDRGRTPASSARTQPSARHAIQDRHRLCEPGRGRHRDGARRGAGQGSASNLEIAHSGPARIG